MWSQGEENLSIGLLLRAARRMLVLLFATFALIACGGGSGGNLPQADISDETILESDTNGDEVTDADQGDGDNNPENDETPPEMGESTPPLVTDRDGDFYYNELTQTIFYRNTQADELTVVVGAQGANRVFEFGSPARIDRQRGVVYIEDGKLYFAYVHNNTLFTKSLLNDKTVCPLDNYGWHAHREGLPSAIYEWIPNSPFEQSILSVQLANMEGECGTFGGIFGVTLSNENHSTAVPGYTDGSLHTMSFIGRSSLSSDHTLRVWDVKDREMLHETVAYTTEEECNGDLQSSTIDGSGSVLVMVACETGTRIWFIRGDNPPVKVLDTETKDYWYQGHDEWQAFFTLGSELYVLPLVENATMTRYASDYDGFGLILTRDYLLYAYEASLMDGYVWKYKVLRRDNGALHWDTGDVKTWPINLFHIDYANNRLYWNRSFLHSYPLKSHMLTLDLNERELSDYPFLIMEAVIDAGKLNLVGYRQRAGITSNFSSILGPEYNADYELVNYQPESGNWLRLGDVPATAVDPELQGHLSAFSNGHFISDLFLLGEEKSVDLWSFSLTEEESLTQVTNEGAVYPVDSFYLQPHSIWTH